MGGEFIGARKQFEARASDEAFEVGFDSHPYIAAAQRLSNGGRDRATLAGARLERPDLIELGNYISRRAFGIRRIDEFALGNPRLYRANLGDPGGRSFQAELRGIGTEVLQPKPVSMLLTSRARPRRP